jgi:hypothetical protein
MASTIDTLHQRKKDLKDQEAAASAPAASAPDLKPSPASSFFKSPTAPAGQVVGRPQPPAKMIRK